MLEAMEELADAIEDAQYVNAISSQGDGPKPVIPWEKPTYDELVLWEQRVKSEASTFVPFSLEWCCQQPIGYFLFSQFIKKRYKDYARINFCEDVLRYRKLQTKQERLDLTVQIARFFLGFEKSIEIVHAEAPITESISQSDFSVPMPEKRMEGEIDNLTEESLASPPSVKYFWPVPPRTEIKEYDLARPVHGELRPSETTSRVDALDPLFGISKQKMIDTMYTSEPCISKMSTDELDALLATGTDYPICSESIIGLKGPLLAEILSIVQANASAVSSPKTFQKSDSKTFQKSDSMYRRSSSDSLSLHFIDSRNPTSNRSILDMTFTNNSTAITNDFVSDNGVPENHNQTAPSSQRSLDQKVVSLPTDFFDKAEYVIMESLKRQYWSSFVESAYWIKLKHFLWYQDRRVIPEDFFVLRVLGRGGFGLVTGKNEQIIGLFYIL
jgi:hypothetical protein